MNFLRKIIDTIKSDFLLKHIVLAVSFIVILLTIVSFCLFIFTRHGVKHEVLDFRGLTPKEAQHRALSLRLKLEVIDSIYVANSPKGVILEQYPKAGNVVKGGRRILLTTNAFKPKMVPLPYVAGFSLRQAKNKIVGAGFTIERLQYEPDLATNNVLKQIYKGRIINSRDDIMGEIGSGVILVVGSNPTDPSPIVPNLAGMTLLEAKNRLWEAGFNVGNIDKDKSITAENLSKARVYFQSPEKGKLAMYGRTITLGVSLDKNRVSNAVSEAAKIKDETPTDSLTDIIDEPLTAPELKRSVESPNPVKKRNNDNDDDFFR